MVRKGNACYAQNDSGRYCCPTYEDQCPPTYTWVWDDYLWAWRLEKQNSGSSDTKDCQTSASSPCCTIPDTTDCVEQPVYNSDTSGAPTKKKSSIASSSSYESEEDTDEKSIETYEDGVDFSNQVESDEVKAPESEAESELTIEESESESEEDVSNAAYSYSSLLAKEAQPTLSTPKAASSKLAKSPDQLKSTSVKYVHQNKDFYHDLDEKPSGKSGKLKKVRKKDSEPQSSYDGSSYESSDIYSDSKDASTSTYHSSDSLDPGGKNDKQKSGHPSLAALTQKIMESRAAGVDPVAILTPAISMNDQGVGTYRPFVDPELSASEAVQTVDLPDYNLPGSIFFNPAPAEPGQIDPSYSFPIQEKSRSNSERGPQLEAQKKPSSKYQRFLHSVKSKFKSKK